MACDVWCPPRAAAISQVELCRMFGGPEAQAVCRRFAGAPFPWESSRHVHPTGSPSQPHPRSRHTSARCGRIAQRGGTKSHCARQFGE